MIIGLSGKPKTGKSTVSDLVVSVVGCSKVSFGDCIRDEAEKYYGVPREMTLDDKGKESRFPVSRMSRDGVRMFLENGVLSVAGIVMARIFGKFGPSMTVRSILQRHATEVRRKADGEYWVDLFRAKAGAIGGNILVDDVRMENEADAILDMGGKVVRLEPWAGWASPAGSDYVTETDLDSYGRFSKVIKQVEGNSGQAAKTIISMFENEVLG